MTLFSAGCSSQLVYVFGVRVHVKQCEPGACACFNFINRVLCGDNGSLHGDY